MNQKDREIVRSLAGRWMELASLPVMQERKRLWAAMKDLRAERPMVLFETWTLENHVSRDELECEAPFCAGSSGRCGGRSARRRRWETISSWNPTDVWGRISGEPATGWRSPPITPGAARAAMSAMP